MFQPTLAVGIALVDMADNGCAHRLDTGEMEGVTLEAFRAVRTEGQTVEGSRHNHGADDSDGLSGEQFLPAAIRQYLHCKARSRDLLEASLEQGRNIAQPMQANGDQMLGPGDVLLRGDDALLRLLFVPDTRLANEGTLHLGQDDLPNLVSFFRPGPMTSSQGRDIMIRVRARMAVDDEYAYHSKRMPDGCAFNNA